MIGELTSAKLIQNYSMTVPTQRSMAGSIYLEDFPSSVFVISPKMGIKHSYQSDKNL